MHEKDQLIQELRAEVKELVEIVETLRLRYIRLDQLKGDGIIRDEIVKWIRCTKGGSHVFKNEGSSEADCSNPFLS